MSDFFFSLQQLSDRAVPGNYNCVLPIIEQQLGQSHESIINYKITFLPMLVLRQLIQYFILKKYASCVQNSWSLKYSYSFFE